MVCCCILGDSCSPNTTCSDSRASHRALSLKEWSKVFVLSRIFTSIAMAAAVRTGRKGGVVREEK